MKWIIGKTFFSDESTFKQTINKIYSQEIIEKMIFSKSISIQNILYLKNFKYIFMQSFIL